MLHQLPTSQMPESNSEEGPLQGAPRLEQREFVLFRQLIRKHCGLRMADSKRLLLQNRIGKRLRALGLTSFRDYFQYLNTIKGRAEMANLWSAVTTNETHFFREPHHFEGLTSHILPSVVERAPVSRIVRIWSAACSTGQEPYTLAMVLDRWLSQKRLDWRYRVVGSDIDRSVIEHAKEGRYPLELRKEVPSRYLIKYFRVTTDTIEIDPTLQSRVSFINHNFADISPLRPRFDVIFCRNAIMYLHKDARARLLRVFYDSLLTDGWLILGTSESLQGVPHRFKSRKLGPRCRAYQRIEQRHNGGNADELSE